MKIEAAGESLAKEIGGRAVEVDVPTPSCSRFREANFVSHLLCPTVL